MSEFGGRLLRMAPVGRFTATSAVICGKLSDWDRRGSTKYCICDSVVISNS